MLQVDGRRTNGVRPTVDCRLLGDGTPRCVCCLWGRAGLCSCTAQTDISLTKALCVHAQIAPPSQRCPPIPITAVAPQRPAQRCHCTLATCGIVCSARLCVRTHRLVRVLILVLDGLGLSGFQLALFFEFSRLRPLAGHNFLVCIPVRARKMSSGPCSAGHPFAVRSTRRTVARRTMPRLRRSTPS